MAIRALNIGQVRDHILEDDKVEPRREGESEEDFAEREAAFKPTVWKVRTLDSKVLAILRDRAAKLFNDKTASGAIETSTRVSQRGYYFEVASLGLDEPENFLEPDGTKVRWETLKREIGGKTYTVVADNTLGKIEGDYIAELAEAIIAGNHVTAAEGNGSASQS